MMNENFAAQSIRVRQIILALAILYFTALTTGCVASRHPTASSDLGRSASAAEMLAVLEQPGPVRLETVVAADWSVPLSGLLNLDHPLARHAGLTDRDEQIKVYFHVIDHPRFGIYIVDSGVAEAFRDPATNPHLSFIVKKAMNTDSLIVRTTTSEWLRARQAPLAGVFLTHIHLDHIMGLPDVPADTPVYTGPAETGAEKLVNLFSSGTTDSLLGGVGALREWPFEADADDLFAGVVDVFGDGSVWALHVPGHSPGSTAFLVRSTDGPVLLAGDASHTNWGWNHGVEPGTFSDDKPTSVRSLAALRGLVERFPQLDVRLGHQPYLRETASAMEPSRVATRAVGTGN
jgi:N-acyl homoserine lactone hydrolase